MSMGCNSDSECPGAPATVCSGGMCVPGCANGGSCTAPLKCDPVTGHCSPGKCARDLDCDPGSYCTQAANCAVLAFGGAMPCQGGTPVFYSCATQQTPSGFTACAGAPGPTGCPYCLDNSCFHPGVCQTANDCHGGDACSNGLCTALAPQCPTTVAIGDIYKGVYAAGKEVCVRDTVQKVRQGYDGMLEVQLGVNPFLYVDIAPMYQAAGVSPPTVGQTVTVHGTVRWDGGHMDRELAPVDWIGP
jgi:hypothetical protein